MDSGQPTKRAASAPPDPQPRPERAAQSSPEPGQTPPPPPRPKRRKVETSPAANVSEFDDGVETPWRYSSEEVQHVDEESEDNQDTTPIGHEPEYAQEGSSEPADAPPPPVPVEDWRGQVAEAFKNKKIITQLADTLADTLANTLTDRLQDDILWRRLTSHINVLLAPTVRRLHDLANERMEALNRLRDEREADNDSLASSMRSVDGRLGKVMKGIEEMQGQIQALEVQVAELAEVPEALTHGVPDSGSDQSDSSGSGDSNPGGNRSEPWYDDSNTDESSNTSWDDAASAASNDSSWESDDSVSTSIGCAFTWKTKLCLTKSLSTAGQWNCSLLRHDGTQSPAIPASESTSVVFVFRVLIGLEKPGYRLEQGCRAPCFGALVYDCPSCKSVIGSLVAVSRRVPDFGVPGTKELRFPFEARLVPTH